MLFLAFLWAALIHFATPQIGCRDEAGNLVDWWYVVKFPKDPTGQIGPVKSDGTRYMFRTSDSTSWTDSWNTNLKINVTGCIFEKTLQPVYNSSVAVIMYNDQTVNLPSDDPDKGHSKGVLAAGEGQGFWLVHSVPKFHPALNENLYSYPETGKLYAQSALCMSLPTSEVEKAADQLIMNQVQVYSKNLPEALRPTLPVFAKLVDSFQIQKITTLGGATFTSFAKTGEWGKELYRDLVAPKLSSNLSVETWRLGTTDFLKSDCTTNPQVTTVSYIEIDQANYRFSASRDHSKWAVSNSTSEHWICIGDINRQDTQAKRGGGTVCQNSVEISDFYRDIIRDCDPCA